MKGSIVMTMTPLFDFNFLSLLVSHCCILALPSRFLGSSRQKEYDRAEQLTSSLLANREWRTTSLCVSFFSTFLDIQTLSL